MRLLPVTERRIIAELLIVFAVAFSYANALGGPFLWDDEVTVVGNPMIRDLRLIPSLFRSTLFAEQVSPHGFYRPVATLTYALEYALFGLNPAGYHLTSIILHALNAILVLRLAERLLRRRWPSLGVALLFAVHPVGIEAVTYVSGRNDVLFAALGLGSILAFLRGLERPRSFIPAVVFFLLALLTKETAVVVPLLIVLLLWCLGHRLLRLRSRGTAVLAVMLPGSLAYAAIRLAVIGGAASGALSPIAEATLFQRILTVPRILLTALRVLVWPVSLHMEYQFVETNISSLSVVVGIPLLALLFGCAVAFLRPRRLVIASLLWFLAALLPVINVVVATTATFREHWLYLPMVGISIVAFLLVERLLSVFSSERFRRVSAIAIVVTAVLLLGAATVRRNRDWLDPLRLYAHDVALEPRSFVLWNNLGVEHYRRGEIGAARGAFAQSIAVSPGRRYSMAHNNLGVVLEQQGDPAGAAAEWRTSIALSGERLAYGNLSRFLLRQGKTSEARAVIGEGLRWHPTDSELLRYDRAVGRSGTLSP